MPNLVHQDEMWGAVTEPQYLTRCGRERFEHATRFEMFPEKCLALAESTLIFQINLFSLSDLTSTVQQHVTLGATRSIWFCLSPVSRNCELFNSMQYSQKIWERRKINMLLSVPLWLTSLIGQEEGGEGERRVQGNKKAGKTWRENANQSWHFDPEMKVFIYEWGFART